MSIINKINSFVASILDDEFVDNTNFIKEWNLLENEIILYASDSGDGICRESLINYVKNDLNGSMEYNYNEDTINLAINKLLHEGKLITDGEQIIDINMNGGKIIKNGKMLLLFDTDIRVPENTCPKCWQPLGNDGRCINAIYDC